jgi:RimJ/RimL family protein N-acetyltransferase
MKLRRPLADGAIALKALDPSAADGPYLAWMNDATVSQFLESRFTAHSVESLVRFIDASNEAPHILLAGIFLDGRHVGNIKLTLDMHHQRAEIGIVVGDLAVWGRGVGRTAIKLASAYAVEELGITKLSAGCYAGNVGSIRAFEAAGFHREAVRPGHYIVDGKRVDGVYLARFAADTVGRA